MKNVLIHNGTSQQLLSNVDDGSNTLFINGTEVPSSEWIGSGYYTQIIEGTTITIAKVSTDEGNVMLQQIGLNTYQLIVKTSSGGGNYLIWS